MRCRTSHINTAPDSAILEFENVINGIKVNGIDMIHWNADGQIIHFKVMVRPLKAINMLHRLMGEQLAAMQAAQGRNPSTP